MALARKEIRIASMGDTLFLSHSLTGAHHRVHEAEVLLGFSRCFRGCWV